MNWKNKFTSLPLNIRKDCFPFLYIAFVLIESGKETYIVEESEEMKMCKTALIMEC